MEEPQIAEKAAQDPMVAAANAPRTPLKTALAASNNSLDMLAREATAPIKINKGTTVKE